MKKEQRLHKNEDFIQVIKTGKKLFSSYFSIYYISSNKTQVGISVSKKVSKLAVDRNKVKRQISAIFRQHFDFSLNLKIVLIAKPLILNAKFNEILAILLKLFNKIR